MHSSLRACTQWLNLLLVLFALVAFPGSVDASPFRLKRRATAICTRTTRPYLYNGACYATCPTKTYHSTSASDGACVTCNTAFRYSSTCDDNGVKSCRDQLKPVNDNKACGCLDPTQGVRVEGSTYVCKTCKDSFGLGVASCGTTSVIRCQTNWTPVRLNGVTTKCECSQNGFELVGEQCVAKCPADQHRNDQGGCTACGQAEYYSGTAFGAAATECSADAGATVCSPPYQAIQANGKANCACADGTFDKDSTCAQCPDHAAKCNAQGVATDCATGYVLQDNACVPCSNVFGNGATECSADAGASKCSLPYQAIQADGKAKCACADGTYDKDSTCAQCPDHATKCNAQGVATDCATGYVLQDNACVPCSNVFGIGATACSAETGASECATPYQKFEADGKTKCGCADGSYDTGSDCAACPEHATKCDGQGHPSACVDGWYPKDNSCAACPNGATKCDNQGVPTQCDSQYFLDGGRCSACKISFGPGTTACTSSGATACSSPFVKVQVEKQIHCGCPDGTYNQGGQ
ncbi:hypothetical protein ACM66B_003327 [Microbotryomycetes sp. NB124-2]